MKLLIYRSAYLNQQQSSIQRRISRGVWRYSLPRRLPRTQTVLGLSSWLLVVLALVWTNNSHPLLVPGVTSSQVALASSATPAVVATLPGGPTGGLLPPGTLAAYKTYSNNYSRGQCTWYVASRRPIPTNWGNAKSWLSHAQASGWSTGTTPAVGAVAWTSAGYYGHVAVVEAVNGNTVMVAEMNFNGPYNIDRRWTSASSWRYIY